MTTYVLRFVLMLGLFFLAAALQAQVHYHPSTDEVWLAGPEEATVCYNAPSAGTGVGPGPAYEWLCYTYGLWGAKDPVVLLFPEPTQVRINGARWVYGVDQVTGQLVPMGVVDER